MKKKHLRQREVPVLSGKDFCRGALENNGQCCMVGWAATVFGGRSGRLAVKRSHDLAAWYSIPEQVRQALIDTRPKGIEFDMNLDGDWGKCWGFVIDINDSKKRRTSTLAKWWNRAMASLGYVVGNPEA